MMKDLYNILISTAKILGTPQIKNKTSLILQYAKIKLKNRLFTYLKMNPQFEHVLGYKIHFFNYSTFTYLFEEIFVRRTYYFLSSKESPFIIDCGSNVGLSVLFLKSLYPKARILAFEPDPATFELLKKNIAANNLKDVTLYNRALMDRQGVMDFYTDAKKLGSLSMSYLNQRGGSIKTEVPCTPLSPFIDKSVDFLKMDIEGAESLCLEELKSSGRLGHVREMIIECHHNMGDTKVLSEILPMLDTQGYTYQISAQPQTTYQFKQDVMVHAVLP